MKQETLKNNFVLLQTNRFDKHNYSSFLFSNPHAIISCYRLEDVKKAFHDIEDFLSRGFYAAGFISYESGFHFENNLKGLYRPSSFPLLWFGIYKRPLICEHAKRIESIRCGKGLSYKVTNLRPNISKKKYISDIEKIKDFIRRGDTYQVNYTFKYKFGFSGSDLGFYQDLKEKQSVSYSAFIRADDFSILSLSPELFFRKNRESIEVRPMKGTLDRGINLREDRRNMEILKQSLKNRSENVMIVDLLRNDLGRVSRSGSVKTEELFRVERYETLLQMISIIKSKLRKDITLYELFKSIFPSGSVTGAPKISTMKIINYLEKEPRNVYTGGIGFFAPGNKKAVFNVAIRTVLIDNKTKKGEIGVGSGIVYDSDPCTEFEECKLKTNFLIQKKKDFKLIETMLWRPLKGYFVLKHHLERLASSADYFGFRYDKRAVAAELKRLERKFKDSRSYKVRILLDKKGELESSYLILNNNGGIKKVRFSDAITSSNDIFFYHKTTKRDLYDKELERWGRKGYFDLIFTNEKKQVTEGAISNIIIKKGRYFYTPPLKCGLLDGVCRRYLFEAKKIPLKEKILYKSDIKNADEIYMVNSVRGMTRVIL